jgi:hypothetical protein
MRPKLTWNRVCFVTAVAVLAMLAGNMAPAAEDAIKVEAQLIWGTNDSKSPNPRHKPVDAEVRKRLKELPLKWTNYFEENRKRMELPLGASHKEALSDKCSIEVKYLGNSKVEVSLIGKGEPVVKRMQDLPRGEMLVLGGNAPNSTSWLVVVKRLD